MNRVLRPAAALVKLRTPKYIIQTSVRKFSESSAFAMPAYKGGCYCGELKYTVDISPDDARTSLCHCKNCKKFFGTAFGLTTKVPISSFSYTSDSKKPTIHEADNGSGTMLHREFCPTCGSGILEVGEPAMKDFRYIMTGTLDHPGDLPPKGEFFCRRREKWMPEVPGIFHKQEIKE
ncbi:hypothetical protein OEA41_008928 [Lepraria neglecta]|uniref:CENP-V/GFA domain-containing protein n=1 Tax=Lepraria neglecta TaxID=209136 RepID=A0AAD9Z0N0_9LECA|nr:hypothetical protein OEA41_008928 [Lepraria neglecta]